MSDDKKMALKMYNPSRKRGSEEKLQMHLGVNLQKIFAGTVSEPLPESISTLLDRLERAESADQAQSEGSNIAKTMFSNDAFLQPLEAAVRACTAPDVGSEDPALAG